MVLKITEVFGLLHLLFSESNANAHTHSAYSQSMDLRVLLTVVSHTGVSNTYIPSSIPRYLLPFQTANTAESDGTVYHHKRSLTLFLKNSPIPSPF